MEDTKIIDLYWLRSESAIAETQQKYGPYCYSIAEHILSCHEDSEECVSDTCLRAWNAMPPSRPGCLRVFLGRITRNLALDRYRERMTDKRGGGQVLLVLDELRDCAGREDSPLDAVEKKRMARVISAYLRTLPAEKQSMFLLRYWYLSSVADIARELGISESKVKSDLYRIRKKLRRELEREDFSV